MKPRQMCDKDFQLPGTSFTSLETPCHDRDLKHLEPCPNTLLTLCSGVMSDKLVARVLLGSDLVSPMEL